MTAASRFPLSFLDHRLRAGNSLLGIPAVEVVRPWVRPGPKKTSKAKPKAIKPVELLISPKTEGEVFDFAAPSHKALCQSFTLAFARLRELRKSIEQEPTNFALHQARHAALRNTLAPWWEAHQLRIGCAFAREAVHPDVINEWLRDLVETGKVGDEHRAVGKAFVNVGEAQGGFCWELAFPEVFFGTDGQRRDDAGFACVLGNPPWDKIKPERDGFYLAYEPLIRQFQGTAKNRHIEELHQQNPSIEKAWSEYETKTKALAEALRDGGIYHHQTAIVEEEVEGEDGEPVIKHKTTGGDPDLYKFFLERSWQLLAPDRMVGMVMSSSLHNGQGATGLRRLLTNQCRLHALVKFDNELRVFPGVHNQFKFDIVVSQNGGSTQEIDAAFFTRETEQALQHFRTHRCFVRLPAADIRRLSPQLLTFFEFRSQQDVDLVEKAYRLHPTFGDGLMAKLGLKFRREFDMGNSTYLFRTREWLRAHGCTQEPGEQWRAANAEWYRERGYFERPMVEWYVLYQNGKVVAHKLPWKATASKIKREDLHDFTVRLELPDKYEFLGKPPEGADSPTVFTPADEVRDTDLPAYIPVAKKLKDFTFGPAIVPDGLFVPLMEGKWIYHLDERAYAYVSGGGSWVVTRPCDGDEQDILPHYFMSSVDAETRTPKTLHPKIGFRDVSSASNERTIVCTPISPGLPCNHKTPVFWARESHYALMLKISIWLSSFTNDFFSRVTGGSTTLSAMKERPAPSDGILNSSWNPHLPLNEVDRAISDAVMAAYCGINIHEYAYILSTFPLLDRDQPPLPHDYRIRETNKGTDWRQISFITRDLALLTYFDYLAGRLELKPDPERVKRICPDGVPDPPGDIVEFFAEAGVDIGCATDYAVAATGPYRNLRERVALAGELGAVAYVPTIDRRRATFVEQAAAAGGLSPEEGVLTLEMAERVLRDKAERDAKWQRAMELWEKTPDPRAQQPPQPVTNEELKTA